MQNSKARSVSLQRQWEPFFRPTVGAVFSAMKAEYVVVAEQAHPLGLAYSLLNSIHIKLYISVTVGSLPLAVCSIRMRTISVYIVTRRDGLHFSSFIWHRTIVWWQRLMCVKRSLWEVELSINCVFSEVKYPVLTLYRYGLPQTVLFRVLKQKPAESTQYPKERVAEIHISCCCDCYCLGTNATSNHYPPSPK